MVEVAPRREEFTDESHYRADNSGKSLDFSASLHYGDSEVLQLLRARKTRLSLNNHSTLKLDTEFRVLFEWLPDAKRRAAAGTIAMFSHFVVCLTPGGPVSPSPSVHLMMRQGLVRIRG